MFQMQTWVWTKYLFQGLHFILGDEWVWGYWLQFFFVFLALTEPSFIISFIKICSEKQEWKYINLWTDTQLKFFFCTTVTFISCPFISAPTGTILNVRTIRPSSILQMRTAHCNLMVLHLSWGRVVEPRHLFVNPCLVVLLRAEFREAETLWSWI